MPKPSPYDLEISPEKALRLASACNSLADRIEAYLPVIGCEKRIFSLGIPFVYKAVWVVERIFNPRCHEYKTVDPKKQRGLISSDDIPSRFFVTDPLWICSHHILQNCLNPLIELLGWEMVSTQSADGDYRRDSDSPVSEQTFPEIPSDIPHNLRVYSRILVEEANQENEILTAVDRLKSTRTSAGCELEGNPKDVFELIKKVGHRMKGREIAEVLGWPDESVRQACTVLSNKGLIDNTSKKKDRPIPKGYGLVRWQ